MSLYNKIGTISYIANKLKTAVDLYEIAQAASDPATRDQAMYDAATHIAEAAAVGIPLALLDQLVTKTGLDRVFDSLSTNATFQQYLKDQVAARNIRDFTLGQLGEFGLHQLRDWVIANQLLDPVFSNALGTTPDPLVKTLKYVPYVDPLILDLDGDGLEITPLSQGIQFDTNGDSIKTGTAWAGAEDGLLVLDLNGNGSIDSGAELFGDETVLANGQKAANGFAALRDLDSGSVVDGVTVGAGDGVFDANDAQYANLRIWRDLNQDGVSQAGELQTLAESGVQSINLSSTATNTNYGDAILVQSSTYTRTDGSTGSAGSFILAQNNFASTFTPLTASAEAMALPDIQGSGWVRDLQEAATLSPELIAAVNQVRDASTRAGYKDAIATLLREWGNDSGYNNASKQAMAGGYGLILSDPQDDQERGWMDSAIKASAADRDAYLLNAANDVVFEARRVA